MTLQAAEMRCSSGVGSLLWGNHPCLVWVLTVWGYMEWVVVVLTSFAFCCLMELRIVTFNCTKPVMQILPGGCEPCIVCSEYVHMVRMYIHTYVRTYLTYISVLF